MASGDLPCSLDHILDAFLPVLLALRDLLLDFELLSGDDQLFLLLLVLLGVFVHLKLLAQFFILTLPQSF